MAIELILKVHKKFNPLPILQNSENDNIRLVYATKKGAELLQPPNVW